MAYIVRHRSVGGNIKSPLYSIPNINLMMAATHKYPAKSFSGFFHGKTAFTNRGWTRMNADESAPDRHLRYLRLSAVPSICKYLEIYGQVLIVTNAIIRFFSQSSLTFSRFENIFLMRCRCLHNILCDSVT